MPDRRDEVGAMTALALVGQVGLMVVAPLAAGVWLGVWFDAWLGTGGVALVAGVVLGLAGGVWGAWRVIAREIERS
jgi:hypothetical protein